MPAYFNVGVKLNSNLLGLRYKRLFIKSSKVGLEAVLLHNANEFLLVPIGHERVLLKYEISPKEDPI